MPKHYPRAHTGGLIALFVGAMAGGNAAATVSGTVQQLTTGTATDTQTWPMISGTNVVWTDVSTNFNVFYLDVSKTLPAVNLTPPGEQEFLEDIDGNSVVFTRTSATSSGDIVLYTLPAVGGSVIASATTTTFFEQPAVRGHFIAYVANSNGQSDIGIIDNSVGGGILITNDKAPQQRPRLTTSYVVWEDYTNGNADVYGWLIDEGTAPAGPFPIATGPSGQTAPDIDGDWVVWIDDNGGDQVWAYNLVTKLSKPITKATSNKIQARVSGTRVVWADDRGGDLDIYTYDLSTDAEDVLVSGPGDQTLSDIDGYRVVYTSNASGFESVYLYNITDSDPPPPNDPPEGCDDAKTTVIASATITSGGGGWWHRNWGGGFYGTQAGKKYWMCVDNGKADGTERTSKILAWNDFRVEMTPADFQPASNPPQYVAVDVTPRTNPRHGGFHTFGAAIFDTGDDGAGGGGHSGHGGFCRRGGSSGSGTSDIVVNVTIRVAK